MKKFILQRIGYSLISLFLLTLTIFLFVRLTGDPTVLLVEPGASREARQSSPLGYVTG